MMLCLEWWAFEAMVIMSGYIGVNEQAAQIILLNIVGLMFFLALGLQQAASSNIGHEIGRKNIEKAKLFMNITNKVSVMFIGSAVFSFYVFHR
jgi:Na+-driven multidrug efflux pump